MIGVERRKNGTDFGSATASNKDRARAAQLPVAADGRGAGQPANAGGRVAAPRRAPHDLQRPAAESRARRDHRAAGGHRRPGLGRVCRRERLGARRIDAQQLVESSKRRGGRGAHRESARHLTFAILFSTPKCRHLIRSNDHQFNIIDFVNSLILMHPRVIF